MELTTLEQLVRRTWAAARGRDEIALGTLVEALGRRSFGSLLLVAGLIAVSPLSGIPGVPTTVAVIVGLIAGQLLCGREHFWLPEWVLRLSLSRNKLEKVLGLFQPLARVVDRLLRPRLAFLTGPAGAYVIAGLCVLIALVMPTTEVIPFSATLAGAAISAFGLALIARDGVAALIALLLTVGIAALAAYGLL